MKRKPITQAIFQQGDDLPLFSSAPMRGRIETFQPEESGQQPELFSRPPVLMRGARKVNANTLPYPDTPLAYALAQDWHALTHGVDLDVDPDNPDLDTLPAMTIELALLSGEIDPADLY